MNLRFTKMQGAGNDFVVLDATRAPLALGAAQIRRLGDRRYGVGADQILVVEPSPRAGIDFGYRIFNGTSGDEVEQCGNGARCVARFLHEHGLSNAQAIRVATANTSLELRMQPDGRVTVDMGRPVFQPAAVPFDAGGLVPGTTQACAEGTEPFGLWPLEVDGRRVDAAVLSMGNPHAVLDIAQFDVADVERAPVESLGPLIEHHRRFPHKTNVGFVQVLDRGHIKLRVWERDAGETLACGSGACAAVVAGIRRGRLDAEVEVEARGGTLTIAWPGANATVSMTGPAVTVYAGEIEL